MAYDLLIRGGRVVDGFSGRGEEHRDVQLSFNAPAAPEEDTGACRLRVRVRLLAVVHAKREQEDEWVRRV